jgi:hypothetical protein
MREHQLGLLLDAPELNRNQRDAVECVRRAPGARAGCVNVTRKPPCASTGSARTDSPPDFIGAVPFALSVSKGGDGAFQRLRD